MLSATVAKAQIKVVADAIGVAMKDTTKMYQGFTLNTDLIGPLQLALSDHGHYEAGIRANLFDKYFPALEVGYGKADHVDDYDDKVTFKTSAPFFRLGCDYNILKKKHDVYRMYAGGRYCFSYYKYDTTSTQTITDDNGDAALEYTYYNDQKGSCHWLEAVFGVDAQIWKNFHLGWDLRYKRRLFQSKTEAGEPWYVPGMGVNNGAQLSGRFLVMLEF